jgi:lauroyl/myristoyl acyltransferase
LLDRHLGRDRVEVSFFGRPTAFLRTPAMVAYMSRAPLLPAFMVRGADGHFVGTLGEPIRVDSTIPAEQAVAESTQLFASQLERQIRANPHLWYQFYRYWPSDSDAPLT